MSRTSQGGRRGQEEGVRSKAGAACFLVSDLYHCTAIGYYGSISECSEKGCR